MDPQLKLARSQPTTDPREQKLLAEQHRLHLRVEELEHEIDCLEHSLSWKLTYPLRQVRPTLGWLKSTLRRRLHRMGLNPFSDLIADENDGFRVVGSNPYFLLGSSRGYLPTGWVTLSLGTHRGLSEVSLYVDSGYGFSEEQRLMISLPEGLTDEFTVDLYLPRFMKHLRIDPGVVGEKFSLADIRVRERRAVGVYLRAFLSECARRKGGAVGRWKFVKECVHRFLKAGPIGLKSILLPQYLNSDERNRLYRKTYVRQQVRRLEEQRNELKYRPLISILLPVYNTPEKWLRLCIESVLLQKYENWELCIADDASTRPSVREVLEEFRQRDKRIRIVYRECNEHISEATNTALQIAEGEFIALLDHDDELHPYALQQIVHVLQEKRDLALIFTDEDRINKRGERLDPYLKLGWDPELLLSQNCVSHLGVYRTAIAKKVKFRKGMEGSQDWDFTLRFLRQIEDSQVKHVPEVLYHWRLVPGTVSFVNETKIDAFRAGERAVQEVVGDAEVVEAQSGGGHRIHWPIRCGLSEVQQFTKNELEAFALSDFSTLLDKPFVTLSEHRLSDTTLLELLQYAEREAIGIVGGKVLQDSGLIKHCGYSIVDRAVVPNESGKRPDEVGYFGFIQSAHQVHAVSSDLCCLRKEIFEEAITWLQGKGFGESDLDLGILLSLVVRSLGFRAIYTPFAEVKSSMPIKVVAFSDRDVATFAVLNSKRDLMNPFVDSRFGPFSLHV